MYVPTKISAQTIPSNVTVVETIKVGEVTINQIPGGDSMVKCDRCDREASYTIKDAFNREKHLCEIHFMEYLKEVKVCPTKLGGCETCD